jgi:DNA-directed RNA polymerase specialized sigma24 family protein
MTNQTILSEETRIASARGGNRNAFGELVRWYSARVYATSFKMLKTREDAQDNLQNVFCEAHGKIRQFKGNSQFSTWLIRIEINEALMLFRKRRSEALKNMFHQGRGSPRSHNSLWPREDSGPRGLSKSAMSEHVHHGLIIRVRIGGRNPRILLVR